jgi:hypothetical protein
MNRRSILSISAMTVLGLALVPSSAVSQQKSLKEQLVGTWILVSCDQSRDGTALPRCVSPSGSLSFDASGRYTAVTALRGRPKLTAGRNSPADEIKAAVQGLRPITGSGQYLFNAYFGTWSVNDADKIITRHMEGALVPNDEGTDTKDSASLAGDELRLVDADPNPIAGASVWRRAK